MTPKILLTSGLLLLAGTALAQSPPLQLERLDADGDGAVARREFDLARAADFRRLDRDRNGVITEDEFLGDQAEGPARDRRRQRFGELDANGDGLVREEEYFDFGRRQFDAFDRDGDGNVTPDEFRAASGAASQEQPARGRDIFAALDRNGDGYITVAELERGRALAFGRLDSDGNGVLGLDEFTRSGRSDAPERFRTLDADGNGRVSESEYVALARALIQRADANGDGRVARTEFEGGD